MKKTKSKVLTLNQRKKCCGLYQDILNLAEHKYKLSFEELIVFTSMIVHFLMEKTGTNVIVEKNTGVKND